MEVKKLKKVFIANRGEIVRRVALTLKRLGIGSVAVYSGREPPGFLQDVVEEWVHVAEENPALFLDCGKMVALAQEAGCDAIHPGFGFLSESSLFAQETIASGLTWIGPNPKAIAEMGSKSHARELAKAAGVPVIPGKEDVPVASEEDQHQLQKLAREIGYPVLLKAALGGGGKGLRRVDADEELWEGAQRAFSEAKSAFGDGRLIIEKYVGTARHIEIQLLGDKHGHVVAVGARDCSVQRRHQKIIEEAPPLGISPATLDNMAAAAVRLGKSVGYDSTGTVEFLFDCGDDQEAFYFLEMNTRLQVEHPVTEELFGLDLVEQQVRMAEGAVLDASGVVQKENIHSVEVRIYAEDAAAGFMPSPGAVGFFRPYREAGVRWELGVDTVGEVSSAFDPMIAKLVVTGATREAALWQLVAVLEKTVLVGPKTNKEFLIKICRDQEFKTSQPTTDFIGRRLADLLQQPSDHHALVSAILEECLKRRRPAFAKSAVSLPFKKAEDQSSGCDMITAEIERVQSSVLGTGKFRGYSHSPWVDFSWVATRGLDEENVWVTVGSVTKVGQYPTNEYLKSVSGVENHNNVVAPVPGRVIAMLATPGKRVQKGHKLAILESMKMEFEVKAPFAGTVDSVLVAAGHQVKADQLLINLQPES